MSGVEDALELGTPYRQGNPLDLDDARKAARAVSTERRLALENLDRAKDKKATAEAVYRKALAKRMVEIRAEGASASTVGDLARGDEHIADLKRERDIADEMVWVFKEQLKGVDGDRELLRSLISWSARQRLDEDQPDQAGTRAPMP